MYGLPMLGQSLIRLPVPVPQPQIIPTGHPEEKDGQSPPSESMSPERAE